MAALNKTDYNWMNINDSLVVNYMDPSSQIKHGESVFSFHTPVIYNKLHKTAKMLKH